MALAKANFVILGGGISGLSAAYYLSKKFPSKAITLIEKEHRVGGWIHSETHTLNHYAVLCEYGPRSLRPVGKEAETTLNLIADLELENEIITVPKSSPAGKHRFLAIDNSLVPLPHSIPGLLRSSLKRNMQGLIARQLISAVSKEPFQSSAKNNVHLDETVNEFISRRFSPFVSNYLVSAVMHGIYAGSIHSLSAPSLLPALYSLERKYGSVVKGTILEECRQLLQREEKKPEFIRNIQLHASMYTFREGMETLTKKLYKNLSSRSNVKILLGTECLSVTSGEEEVVNVKVEDCKTGESAIIQGDQVLCSLPAASLHKIANLDENIEFPAASVGIVNLAFEGDVLQEKGFGFLVPEVEEQRMEEVLGVVFDSAVFPGQGSPGLTRLTMISGGHLYGHYWGDEISNPGFLIEKAEKVCRDILHIQKKSIHSTEKQLEKAIPQWTLGHSVRAKRVEEHVNAIFRGRMKLMGAWNSGVAINQCVHGAFHVVNSIG